MKNSVFDLFDGTPENFIYSSTGQLVKGNEYSKQYTELAKQLDAKRSAFYLESSADNIILGCSLSVKADSGREERAVFIQTYNNLLPQDIILNSKFLTKFYEGIKSEFETIGGEKHRLVGFWEDEEYKTFDDLNVNDEALDYIIRKIYSDKRVSVQISEFSTGFTYFKLIPAYMQRHPLIIDVFQQSPNSFDYKPDIELNKRKSYQIFKRLPPENQSVWSEELVIDETSNSEGNQPPSDQVVEDIYKVEIFLRSSNNGCDFNDNYQSSLSSDVNPKSISEDGENGTYQQINAVESDNGIYNSAYGIYNSTGQLLKGNEHFEQYTELAKQLDTKRSAFYLESRVDKIILGCSLSVKADSGREERVVFIHVHDNLPSQYKITPYDIPFLKKFYERIKSEIETLNSSKYQLVGLWEENDYKHIEYRKIHDDILIYTAGRINSGKKVSVKISELSAGLSFVLKLVTMLGHRDPLMFDVSQYPSNSEVSVSLIKPNPDFEIKENGEYRLINAEESWGFYKELGEESVKNKTSDSNINKNSSDSISLIVKNILKTPSDYCSSDKFIDDFDDRQKVEIFKKLIQEDSKINNLTSKILTNIYHKIKSPECKKEIYKISLSKNIYIETLIKDLLRAIHKEHNRDLFNLLFDYSDNEFAQSYNINSKYDSFKNEVEKSLKYLEDSEKVDFVKYIASESPSKPKARGKILLKTLIEDLVKRQGNNTFLSKLSEEEAENLDKIIRDSNYLSSMKNMKKSKRDRKIKRVFYAIGLVFILLTSHFVIDYIHSTGIDEGNNSSINNSENNLTSPTMNLQDYNNTNISNEAVVLMEDKNSTSSP
ncbi:MAG: hypothetical protein PHR06_12520 [Candidatus Cloacimonetes bacterium]|nr:hypothetical protein [Candidatus Cloacimonadota bacterium]